MIVMINKGFNFNSKHVEKCKCDMCILERFKRNPSLRSRNHNNSIKNQNTTSKPPSGA